MQWRSSKNIRKKCSMQAFWVSIVQLATEFPTLWQFSLMKLLPARKTSATWFSTGALYHLECLWAPHLPSSFHSWMAEIICNRCSVIFVSPVGTHQTPHHGTWNDSRQQNRPPELAVPCATHFPCLREQIVSLLRQWKYFRISSLPTYINDPLKDSPFYDIQK